MAGTSALLLSRRGLGLAEVLAQEPRSRHR
jgi:hypothetical protein